VPGHASNARARTGRFCRAYDCDRVDETGRHLDVGNAAQPGFLRPTEAFASQRERERERERARENPRSEQIFDQDEILTSVVAEKREKGESKAEAKVPICFSSSFPFLFCFFFGFGLLVDCFSRYLFFSFFSRTETETEKEAIHSGIHFSVFFFFSSSSSSSSFRLLL
jgi:hypothetical protein